MESGLGDAVPKLWDELTKLDLFGDEYSNEVIACLTAVQDHPEWEEMWVISE